MSDASTEGSGFPAVLCDKMNFVIYDYALIMEVAFNDETSDGKGRS